MVTRIDRLARSIDDLEDIVRLLKSKGVALNTSTTAGKAFLDMLGVFSKLETNLRREPQMEGLPRPRQWSDRHR